ncbi:MAG: NAD(P)H-hydrate dehydratase [Clostridia bacterium]|nr:NAD(P)H-hydrate dehydratase [Clostridia bacterium]
MKKQPEQANNAPRKTDAALAASCLPARPLDGNKGTFGRALLFCGSEQYRGAACLAAEAALSGGAGLVELASCEAVVSLVLTRAPSVIGTAYVPSPRGAFLPLALAKKATAILVGCGSGASERLCLSLYELLGTPGCPVVLDADALNALSLMRERSLDALKQSARLVILTPHPLEFSRLSGLPLSGISADRVGVASQFACAYGVTLVLKGAGTVIAAPNGGVTVNTTGGPGLAKGGSGDVLAGLLVSLLAEGMTPYDAAILAVYLHGAAGDALTLAYSPYGVRPDDLPREIARRIASLCAPSRGQ